MARPKIRFGAPGKRRPAIVALARPRPQLRDFTKAILPPNTDAAVSWPNGSAALTRRVMPNQRVPRHGPPASRPKQDISTWQRIGHFYLALTSAENKFDLMFTVC